MFTDCLQGMVDDDYDCDLYVDTYPQEVCTCLHMIFRQSGVWYKHTQTSGLGHAHAPCEKNNFAIYI